MTAVALAGNPNCGKTTLFNQLTGLRQRVGNYPGVTVERRDGRARFADIKIIDLPGTYSLLAQGRDEAIAFEVLAGLQGDPAPDLTVIVVDATNLLRNLYLTLSILELGTPAIIALNMFDMVEAQGLSLSTDKLSELLGLPVFPVVAKTGRGVDALIEAIQAALKQPPKPYTRNWQLPADVESLVAEIAAQFPPDQALSPDGKAIWALSSSAAAGDNGDDPLTLLPELKAHIQTLQKADRHELLAFPSQVIEARYQEAKRITEQVLSEPEVKQATLTDRVDRWLLHPVFGGLFFVGVLALVFQGLFSWSDPMIGLIESWVGALQGLVSGLLPASMLTDLLVDGVIGGVGNVIVFVPQIAMLFILLAIMEDSGYLARAAFLSDRLMAKVGLHGRAFVPLISGFACAVPAIMATRSIENRRDRLVTLLVAPLVSCSARLPVYTLLIVALFQSDQRVFGVFQVGGLLMVTLYLMSVLVTILAAFVLKRTVLQGPTPPLVLELPPYRRPEVKAVLRRAFDRCTVFISQAGSVILAFSLILWALLYFPRADPSVVQTKIAKVEASYQEALAEGSAYPELLKKVREEAIQDIQSKANADHVKNSYGGRLGHLVEPLIRPLGFDWKIGVGLLSSFAAREVFISTMGLIYGIGADSDEASLPLRARIQNERHPDTGKPVYTPLTGLSLMVFFLLAAQCMSTLAAVRRETQSWRWPAFMMLYMNVLAWLGSFAVYQGGRLLGFS